MRNSGAICFLDRLGFAGGLRFTHASLLAVLVRLWSLQAGWRLVANGVPAESCRDDGNRWFHNANASWEQEPLEACAPILTGVGPVVDEIRPQLLELAGPRTSLPLTDDHVRTPGRASRPSDPHRRGDCIGGR